MWRQRWNATNRPTGRETDLQAIWARQSWQVCGTNCWCWQGNKAETHAARKFRLALDNIGRSQIWHLMRLTQRIFLLTERYWSRTPLTLYNCWKKKTTTKRQLLRERIGDLNTCLQWLGLSTELKTVSSLFLWNSAYHGVHVCVYQTSLDLAASPRWGSGYECRLWSKWRGLDASQFCLSILFYITQ